MFSHNAVLQQKMQVPIFGKASPGESVVVAIQDHRATTTADVDGRWRVEVGPLRPGGPYQLNVAGSRVSIVNVYVGEVWVCAGGSNMQWTVFDSEGSSRVMTYERNRNIRLYSMKREGASEPRFSNDVVWLPAGSASVNTFSAVGYFFGRELEKHLNVPVGLISCNHYNSTIESWISKEGLAGSNELKGALDKPINSYETKSPTVLFNSMVSPITQYGVRGVLWYQGENAVDQAYKYRFALQTLIADWRKHWQRPDLPFLIVQAAPYKVKAKIFMESKLAELRESQLLTTRQTPGTALVVITDYGDQFDQHPRQKEPVGQRAAWAARGAVYGENLISQGPTLSGSLFQRNEAILRFDNADNGLKAEGDELKGFFVAGIDRVFHPAKGSIQGNTVVLTSAEVPAPTAARYGWADYPDGNLTNAEGLPASPFRTDNFPLVTAPKKIE